ncbi:response regulator [Microvirga pudoricolor]|uniref:response regulator n=1 Tax=Microvirga pudoricolor TaxID=2778729 RepID=UPI00194FDEBA|nr:response regulator [Microvirga pudoricolor]MBM6595056.1 response regulator [Microvirga pudoricolor]
MRILLVDDDDAVRFMVGEALIDSGFDVVRAASGKEALLVLALTLTSAPPIDALVTDIRMPEMNGWEVARRVRDILPELPVVYMTGYIEELEPEVLGGVLLHKPCRVGVLIEAIQTVTNSTV